MYNQRQIAAAEGPLVFRVPISTIAAFATDALHW